MLIKTQAIVLAAGKATRFNTGNTKLTEKVCGQEIILYPLTVLKELAIPTCVVIGFQAQKIKQTISKNSSFSVSYEEQHSPQGTGHALKLTRSHWDNDHILVLKADLPLITSTIIKTLYDHHVTHNADITFVSAHNGDPSGYTYCRIIKHNNLLYIKKPLELTRQELQEHCCVHGGIYLFKRSFLEKELDHLMINNTTYEMHLSDLVNMATDKGYAVDMVSVPFDRIRSVNDHQELWAVEQIKRSELIKYWMDRGVRFCAAQTVHMDLDIAIGAGSFIGSSVQLLQGTSIGTNCTIQAFSIIDRSTIGNNVTVHPYSIIRQAIIEEHSAVGPFAHIQEHTHVGSNAIIGNFVEIKHSTIGNFSKAKHLTYLGNAHIGTHVNIGAGTITCNYDGTSKHTTTIQDYAFIGSNNSLVAPVTIESHAFTAAGSTITETVPARALGIARARQVNKAHFISQEASASSTSEESREELSFTGAYKTNTQSHTFE